MASISRQQLEAYISTLEIKADKVLGAGDAQQGMQKRVKEWSVKEYRILDLPNPHQDNEKVDIVCDLNDVYQFICPEEKIIKEMPIYKSNGECYADYFDIVFLIEVSEYLLNIVQAFRNINYFLKKGGICYFSSHFIYPTHEKKEDDCIRLTKYGIIKLMKETGFEIEELIPRMAVTNLPQMLFQAEKMKACKYHNHSEVGYIVKAKKI